MNFEEMDTDVTDWENERQQERKEATIKLKLLLAEHRGISEIVITYDGSYDSGCFEGPVYLDGKGKPISVDTIAVDALNDAVEEYVCTILPGGWDIHEGSFGIVHIDVDGGKTEIAHARRSVDESHEYHDF